MEVSRLNKYLSYIFIFNCLFALCVGLSHDEAYYWIYSLKFSWGHYDHPPMVGWMIKLGVWLWEKNEFGVRFFFNVMQVVSLYELWKMTNRQNPRLFIYIFLLFPLVFASGVLALPDTPLLFFAILFIKYFLQYLERDDLKTSLALALIISLLFYSKYHGAVVVLFSVLAFPKIVLRKSFWIVFTVSFVAFLPHLLWQIDHEFVTFKYHLFKRKQRIFEIGNVGHYIGSQIAVAGFLAFPIVFMSLIKKARNNQERLIKFNVIGLYLLILLSALRNKIEANWTITSCGFLILLTYQYLTEEKQKWQRPFIFLGAPSVVALAVVFSVVMFLPENLSSNFERLTEVKGWREKARAIIEKSPNKKIVANTYQMGAKLNFYSNLEIPVLHHRVRKSEFLHLTHFPRYNEDEQITFVTYQEGGDNVEKVYIGFPEYVYIHPITTLKEITGNGSKN